MKNKNLSWFAALLVFALLLWCTAVTPGKIADPSTYTCSVYSTIFSLLPPVIAIVLALNTKEVYTSLLVGIASGALLYANGNLELAINTLFFNEDGGMVAKLSDSSNVGILVFLVMLGILVALMNKAGGSAAFGRWASTHIHTRAGAQFATLLLGVLIFVDDYFNCLTVGSVMRPVTDRQKVSRAKLAYLIDATAAPICIIAPISSWAAAVNSYVPAGSSMSGFEMFGRTIPFNLYAMLTLYMVFFTSLLGFDFGLMKKHERNAAHGDLFTSGGEAFQNQETHDPTEGGKYAKAIIGNADTKIIMHLIPSEAKALQEAIQLTSVEMEAVSSLPRGQGLVCSASAKLFVDFVADDYEAKEITTDAKSFYERRKALEKKKREEEEKAAENTVIDVEM